MGSKKSNGQSDLERDADEVLRDVEAGQQNPLGQDRVKEVYSALEEWKEARAHRDAVAKEQQENLKRANVELKECIEAGVPTNASLRDQVAKLRKIEVAWQDVDETKGAASEAKKEARKRFKAAEQRLRDLIEESHQLRMTYEDGPVPDDVPGPTA